MSSQFCARRVMKKRAEKVKIDEGDVSITDQVKLQSPRKRRRLKVDEVVDGYANEPVGWKEIYQKIEGYRKLNVADVDMMGCATLAKNAEDEKLFRYQVLTSLQLSSQTKDPVTAQAIKNLQEHTLTPKSVLAMDPPFLNFLISKVGFHNRKTIYLQETANILITEYRGDIPNTLQGLLSLPGVGPKMAYLTLQEAWGIIDGIGVDTHVHRISNRLGWVRGKMPEDTRKELEGWLPRKYWAPVNVLLVGFGQTMCRPIGPHCGECPVKDLCPRIDIKKKVKK